MHFGLEGEDSRARTTTDRTAQPGWRPRSSHTAVIRPVSSARFQPAPTDSAAHIRPLICTIRGNDVGEHDGLGELPQEQREESMGQSIRLRSGGSVALGLFITLLSMWGLLNTFPSSGRLETGSWQPRRSARSSPQPPAD